MKYLRVSKMNDKDDMRKKVIVNAYMGKFTQKGTEDESNIN